MSEFRAALQALTLAIDRCRIDAKFYGSVTDSQPYAEAKALLAGPEPDVPDVQPVARVINNNQPGWTNIIETQPNITLDVGSPLYDRKAILRLSGALAGAIMRSEQLESAASDLLTRPELEPEPEPRITREWQPIESAPNGKSVLCFWPAVKRNDVNHEAYQGQAWKRFGNWFRTRDGYGAASDMINEPTHWMPLPSPPAASDGEKLP